MVSSIWDPPQLAKLETIPTDLESLIDHANEVYSEYRQKFLGFNTPLDTRQIGQYSKRIEAVLELIRQLWGQRLIHLPLDLPDDLRERYEDLLAKDASKAYNEDMPDLIQ